jgi:hypothetical protein
MDPHTRPKGEPPENAAGSEANPSQKDRKKLSDAAESVPDSSVFRKPAGKTWFNRPLVKVRRALPGWQWQHLRWCAEWDPRVERFSRAVESRLGGRWS